MWVMHNICWSSFGLGLGLTIIILGLAFKYSQAANYRLKFVIYGMACAFGIIWPLPSMFLRPRHWKNALIPAWHLRKVLNLLGIKYIVQGRENIVKNSGAVILINHQSGLDLGVLAELWPVIDNCVVVAKSEVLWYSGLFGLACYMWGTLFIDRARARDAQDMLNSTVHAIKSKNSKLMLFPEGTRHSGSTLKPFKKGAFHVAIAAQVPVQPVVVSKYYYINDELKKFGSGITYIRILPVIPTEGMDKENIMELIEKTWDVMNTEFQRVNEELIPQNGKSKAE